ncbi:phosphatidate cytidylyltransferase [Mesorhizobium sp. LNJC386A00]|nr:phosphatidate cytidylyltransferase [Mesorhizobium sp. LNJC386A00]
MPLTLPPMHETVILLVGLVCVLTTASVIAGILSWRAPKPLPSTLVNLNQRINAWWVMVLAITVAFFFGRTGMTILFALISFAALREFVTLTHSRRSDHWVLLGMFGIIIPFQYWLVWTAWYGLFTIFIPVYCFLLMPAVTALNGDTERFLERVSAQQWAVMISVYCVSHVPALLTLNVPGFEGRNLLLIAFLIITVQGSDVLQYIFGKLFGRHLLSPSVSPSKTWEGLVGGLVASSLLGALLSFLTPFSPLAAAGVAFIACLMGFLGGLVASAIKRDQGVKDWGHLIEGHGGMMDRADSLVFAAPVFFHIVRYFWT